MTELLVSLLPGGSRDRPIKVTSAAVIEVRAGSMVCPACEIGTYRIGEHVSHLGTPGLRRVDVACRHCSTERSLWFRLVPDARAELN